MKMPVVVVVLLLMATADRTPVSSAMDNQHHYLNKFAVQVNGGLQAAQSVAADLGFVVDRELPNIGVFLLKHPQVNHRSKRSSDDHLSRLQSHPKVRYVQQEVELQRVKRNIIHDKQVELPIREIKDDSVYHREKIPDISTREYEDAVTFNDPLYRDMWYLKNHGQSGGEKYLDMNVQVAWANGFNGQGVVVSILDDGVDHTHPDLADNYDPKASGDLNDKSDLLHDPMPNITDPGNSHGTRCAGEVVGAANNNICGVGVAYKAKIGGVRILDGTVTDSLEAEALKYNSDYIDIYSASWGPSDDGKTMEGPSYFAARALRDGVLKGRGGLGSIYVWATGNGGMNGDDCNADGYTSSTETLSVGSITDTGRQPFYMENCTSTLAVVPTGGEEYLGQEDDTGQIKLKVVTTDVGGGCIENFQGTSSAAPLAAGCFANVLQANPALTWRDIQHVTVHGTRIPSADSSWTINGAGHHVSHKFGFGLMDCGKMVHVAQEWNNVPEQHVCRYSAVGSHKIKFGGSITDSMYISACKEERTKWVQRLEHVQVQLKLSTRRRGDTRIFLTSPSGTRSELLSKRPNDSYQGVWEFTFMTVHSWDENPRGKWELEIFDEPESVGGSDGIPDRKPSSPENSGFLESWSLILYGTAGGRYGRASSPKYEGGRSYKPSEEAVQRWKREETENARHIHVKRASLSNQNENHAEGAGSQIRDKALAEIADELVHLLKHKETHEHAKRILTSRTRTLAHPRTRTISQEQSQAKVDGLTGKAAEHNENLLKLEDFLRSLKHLSEGKETESPGSDSEESQRGVENHN